MKDSFKGCFLFLGYYGVSEEVLAYKKILKD